MSDLSATQLKRLDASAIDARLSCVMVLLVALVPIITTSGLFLVDVPNHLFRVSLLSDILHWGVTSSHFHIWYGLYPNMAMDVVTGLLTTIMSPAAALMVFLCGTIVGYFASILYWRASLGEKTDTPIYLLIALVLYSEPLQWGLINYIFGLSLMHVCMSLLNRQTSRPSRFFPVTQAALLAILCLSSIYPVMLYIAFCAGAALETLRCAAPVMRGGVLGRLVRQHGLSAVMVITLVSVMDPGQTGSTNWSLWSKLTGVFTVAKTTHVLLEYVVSALTLLSLGILVWQRGWVADRYARAGVLACCLLYLALPEELFSVHLSDRRLAPAIAGLVLVFVRGPRPANTHFSTKLAGGLSLLIMIKAAILVHVWSPLVDFRASYRTISAAIPSGASVIFIPGLEEEQWGARTRVQAYLQRLIHLKPIPPEEEHHYVRYFHLHLEQIIGKDVYSPHIFTNLGLKANVAERPLLFLDANLSTLRSKLRSVVFNQKTYLISHLDLNVVLPPGVTAHKLIRSGSVTLYRIEPKA
jgi:hypothetical protein